MEIQTLDDLEKKLLDQHHEQYLAFTRLILTLSTGSFSLLASLSGNFLSSAQYTGVAKTALPLLFVSMLAGIFVQHRIMMRPLADLNKAQFLAHKAESERSTDPIKLRRQPSTYELLFYKIQMVSFLGAFIFLGTYALLWKK